MSLDEVRENLRLAKNETEYHLYFAALLRKAAAIPPDNFFVVGGSAIEIHTVGRYTSGDIDIVTDDQERIPAVLDEWGFRKTSRVWADEELRLVVDLLEWPYTGSVERTTIMSTPFGAVRLAAVEDLLVKRLISTKFRGQMGDLEQAKMLGLAFGETMDWEYVQAFAAREDVLDAAESLRLAIQARAEGPKGRKKGSR
jgi:hypothetical protein